MGFEFKLPDIGEGVVEGEIVKWLVQVGDPIDVDQPMVEVMTDKTTVVIPSPKKGTVRELRGAEGDIAEVGSVIVVIDEGGASVPAPEAAATEAPGAPSLPAPPPARPSPAAGAKALAAPATRRLARELGLDITTVAGSGPAGRVMSEDVRRAAAQDSPPTTPAPVPTPAAPAAVPVPSAGSNDQVIAVRGVRRKIWESMTRSAFSAPHFTFVEECDMTELIEYRRRLNAMVPEEDPKLTFLPFIVKAVCVALDSFPGLNGHVDEAEKSFTQRGSKHIGIAVAAEQGLTVPVVRDADRRSLAGLAREIRRLSEAVRSGSLAPTDLGGSTFTITSLGRDGGLLATPILNHPEVGILGVHRLQKRPVVDDDDNVVVRSQMNLSLSCDHRWIDGHIAAQFTYRVIGLLSQPDRLVLEMG